MFEIFSFSPNYAYFLNWWFIFFPRIEIKICTRNIFSTLSNIYDKAFCQNGWKLLTFFTKFTKFNGWKLLTFFTKSCLRCLTGFWIHLCVPSQNCLFPVYLTVNCLFTVICFPGGNRTLSNTCDGFYSFTIFTKSSIWQGQNTGSKYACFLLVYYRVGHESGKWLRNQNRS